MIRTRNIALAFSVFAAAATLCGVKSSEAAPLDGAHEIWVARLTGRTQCEGNQGQQQLRLGEALATFEAAHPEVVIKKALVTRLKDRMFCAACNCPDGTFYAALIEQPEGSTIEADWEVVDAQNLSEAQLGSSGGAAVHPLQ